MAHETPLLAALWLNIAGFQVGAIWQDSHLSVVGIWVAGLALAFMRLPYMWQPEHCFGVPLNNPLI